MGSEWPTVRLGDQITLQRGYDINRSQLAHGGVPVISSSGVIGFHDRAMADGPGVLLGRKGTLGTVHYSAGPYWPHSTALWVRDFHGNDPRFVYYFFKGFPLQHLDVGTANPTLNRNHVHPLPAVWPPLVDQRAIACILGALDDKIELNRRTSRTLDGMVRAIFKSWFVDFEGAGSIDRTTHLPRGWTSRRVGDVLQVVGGTTPSTKRDDYWESGTSAFCTPRDMARIDVPVLLETERSVTDLGLAKTGSGLLPSGTVLMSSRAPIGYVALASLPVAINQGIIAMVCDAVVSSYYALCWVLYSLPVIVSRANGSTFPEISQANFKDIEMIVPSRERLAAFDGIAAAVFSRMVLAGKQARGVQEVRDTIVPRLLSGSLKVARSRGAP